MAREDIVGSLAAHTAGLRPGPGVSAAELTELRRAVVQCLRDGQEPANIGEVPSSSGEIAADAADLAYLAALPPGPASPSGLRMARRTSSLRTALVSSTIPAWSAGLEPAQTFGPFLDLDGRAHWFDLFQILPHVTVFRGNQPLMLLPGGTRQGPLGPSLLIPAGTVWIRASQLAPGPPADGWVGLRVDRGSLAFPQGVPFANGALNLAVAAAVTLEVSVAPPLADVHGAPEPLPAERADAANGPGADAIAADAELPRSATFVFGPLGVERVDTAPARLSIYGTEVSLARHPGSPRFEAALDMVLIPMTATPRVVNVSATHSTLYEPAGSAPIAEAGWGLIVTVSKPASLGIADGAGYVVVRTGLGLEAGWRGLVGGRAPLGPTWIAGSPTSLTVMSPHAVDFRGWMTFELWSESPRRRSTLDATLARPFVVWFISLASGTDAVGVGVHVAANLDRPLLAGGTRVPVELDGTAVVLETATTRTLALEATTQIPGLPVAIALTNALLTVRSPARLFLSGSLGAGLEVERGTLLLEFPLYQIVPTLPDPYAANFGPRLTRDAPVAGTAVTARVAWADVAHPVLDVSLGAPAGAMSDLMPAPGRDHLDPMLDGPRGPRGAYYWMLDVSSGADRLGVSLSLPVRPDAAGSVSVRDLTVHARGVQVQSFLLPQFQWEPVHNMPNDRTGDVDGLLTSNHDGGPAFLLTETVNLVPVAPVPVATELIRAFNDDRAPARSKFTLPFGMIARAELDDPAYRTRPGLALLAVPFKDLTGARQISLTAGTQPRVGPVIGPFALFDRLLAGVTVQTVNFPGQARDNTLGILRDSFNASFTTEVPIQRIDLGGYGATIASRWINPADPDVGITQVSVDAFHGRTAYERVQMVSFLWPCLARLIRTIVLERQGSGRVLRWDSGWIATTDGLFTLPGKFESIHPGAVEGMFAIREIRDTDQIFDVGGATVQAVYYDADVGFVRAGPNPPVVAGQDANGRVPARRQLGFVQLVSPPKGDPGKAPATLLSESQFEQLLARVGPLGGPVDAVIRVGSSAQEMRVTGIYASAGRPSVPGQRVFAVAAYGSPLLPATGRWSVVRVGADRTVQPADARLGVPLIRAKNGPYRWADPADLLHEADPQIDYALLLSHDAQRLLFPRLKVNPGQSNLVSDLTPRIADPYRMLHSTGLFPAVDQALDVGQKVALTGGSLRLVTGTLTFTPGPQQHALVDLPSWKDRLDYRDARFTIDSLAGWKITIERMEQALSFDPGGEIFRIVHDAVSRSDAPTQFGTPAVRFPPALEAVTSVLDMLKQLVPQAMRGGEGPLKFSASLSGTTFRLSAVADFDVADADGNALDCGMGKVKGHLTLGGDLSAELMKRDVHGAVFLELTGSWQQLIFPEIYGGGLLRFAIRADESGQTTFDLDACTVGSVGGSVIPGLVELEATVKYGYFIRFQDGAFQPGFVLGMEGRAKLLSGLLGFKLTVEGRVLVSPKNVPRDLAHAAVHLYGEILVAGTVTLAWLLEERKSFTTSFDVDVDWKTALLIAKTGLVPVP